MIWRDVPWEYIIKSDMGVHRREKRSNSESVVLMTKIRLSYMCKSVVMCPDGVVLFLHPVQCYVWSIKYEITLIWLKRRLCVVCRAFLSVSWLIRHLLSLSEPFLSLFPLITSSSINHTWCPSHPITFLYKFSVALTEVRSLLVGWLSLVVSDEVKLVYIGIAVWQHL